MNNYLRLLASISICSLFYIQSFANTEPIIINWNGEFLIIKQIKSGPLKLFVHTYEQVHTNQIGYGNSGSSTEEVNRYFISNGTTFEELTQYNYKKMIPHYLPNAPDLHKRLGKRGFKYENIPYMIEFYNNHRT